MWLFLFFTSVLAFNNPPGVDIWCGKAYRSSNASFNPGGWFEYPPVSTTPLLDLRVQPRMSLYLDSDKTGSLLIDASVSERIGSALPVGNGTSQNLSFTVSGESGEFLQGEVPLGSTDNEYDISLDAFPPRMTPYNLTLTASIDGYIYNTSTELLRLPAPEGSAVRLDRLYGGLSSVRDNRTEWTTLFPYTYYVQWSLYWDSNVSTLNEFAAMGYNVIHIVPTGTLGDTPFPWDDFDRYLQRADELGLWLQYDVRWTDTNSTMMIEQVERLRDHPSILSWYSADEPDGQSDPINSTKLSYETIKSLDLYHPVSLVLNCANFYYADYAAGADIVMSDVYPIATNTSWSTVYDTPCNATYGCCGCDDCQGEFADISNRLDSFHEFDHFLQWKKPHWGAPQAFGNETFWTRYPTAAEEAVMNLLSVNHGAKGIVMWDFPTSDEILAVTDQLARVLTADDVVQYVLGSPLTNLPVDAGKIDAATWTRGKEMLISVVNLEYNSVADVVLRLPVQVHSIGQSFWGDAKWKIQGDALVVDVLSALEVSLFEVTLL
ncbi:hypothetical protein ASPZODRAFT_67140 [Penicilliopsis zonata CBS 506.65]|uniref:Glycoside hydrolase family 2 catalytic domain-containing protein n=1 Tax=Penicilliopsis zonata CBS 506.65 TaxID=1073090 RepID=A0A1L9SFR7_9EURO|nr:hypothetical protein ASPZODRAFT_67140 [Penicilliopsis zonata CBS 506.65]OJJ46012.1 hypothetical protein ASPZODRAFT_67140 [Penicilliopsis zonata CBS 506.65]